MVGRKNMMGLFRKLVAPFIMIAWATYYFIEVSNQAEQSQYLIRPVYWLSVILCLIIAAKEVVRYRKQEDGESTKQDDVKPMLISISAIVAYLILMRVVGFLMSSLVFLFVAFSYVRVSKAKAAIFSALLTVAIYACFKIFLGVPLPAGILMK